MNVPAKLNALLEKLISDGNALIKAARSSRPAMLDGSGVRRWANELTLFRSIAGDLVKPWSNRLEHDGLCLTDSCLQQPLAALETIKYALEQGLLSKYRNLIFAETFADLSEQADYLLSENYYLAAGVIYRAVLEQKLRQLCEAASCLPEKDRPTISDFNAALYAAKVYDKAVMHRVTALAAIGNKAAHSDGSLDASEVKVFGDGVAELLVRFSE